MSIPATADPAFHALASAHDAKARIRALRGLVTGDVFEPPLVVSLPLGIRRLFPVYMGNQ